MKRISLNSNGLSNMTAVPDLFIDKYMIAANGSYVKLYLYLLRSLKKPFADISISDIADVLEDSDRDILRGLNHWEKLGLISLTRENPADPSSDITSISLNDIYSIQNSNASSRVLAYANAVTTSTPQTSRRFPDNTDKPDSTDTISSSSSEDAPMTFAVKQQNSELFVKQVISDSAQKSVLEVPAFTELMKNDDNFKSLISILETQYVKQPLTISECEFIRDCYCIYHFKSELILDLYEEGISKSSSNKHRINLVKQIANEWHSKGFKSLSDKEHDQSEFQDCMKAYSKGLGIKGRSLGSGEIDIITKWHKEWGFDASMIQLACEQCVKSTGNASQNYVEAILSGWKSKGIHTIEAANKAHEEFKAKKSAKASTKSYEKKAVSKTFYNSYSQSEYTDEELTALELKLLNK